MSADSLCKPEKKRVPADIVLNNPSGLAAPAGHYSLAVKANGFVFVSGQLPIGPGGERLTDASFEAQARQVLANVGAALSSAGSSVEHLVQVRAYLTDIGDWAAFNAIYAEWADAARPARCAVPVPSLHYGFRIEVEAIGLALS
jgi:reactive intermediate/imine deaminase